jgi:phospholipid/cholesterol/gamma-HCH transport system substrate-binding protein
MRKIILAAIVGTGLVCLGLLIVKAPTHRLKVRTYLHHTQGLKPGASVSIDGVRIGSVARVDLGSESTDHPVEVIMLLGTGEQVTIPNDSEASLATEGLLGPTIMEIDTRSATGPPIENNGVIKSLEVTDNQAAHALDVLAMH